MKLIKRTHTFGISPFFMLVCIYFLNIMKINILKIIHFLDLKNSYLRVCFMISVVKICGRLFVMLKTGDRYISYLQIIG